MGWTSIPDYELGGKKTEDIKKFYMNQWSSGNQYKMIDFSKKGNTIYMAVQNLATQEVFAAVSLISFKFGEFYYKDMDETCGPSERKCPQRILKLLSSTDNDYAKGWREDCWNYHKNGKVKKNAYIDGAIIQFENAIEFTDGTEGNTFILRKDGRRTSFAHYTGQTDINRVWGGYRISHWKERQSKIIGYVGEEKMEKTAYIATMTEKIQEEIKQDLIYAGIAGENLTRAMNSRLCDLEDVINIEKYAI